MPTLTGSATATVARIIVEQAEAMPEAAAVGAPGRPPLTYARLRDQIDDVVRALTGLGVRRGDAVAIVLPNGPEMAVAFLAVASCAAAAPLNPAYRAEELDFYLGDLDPRLLVVQSGIDTPAAAVARARGIPVVELSPLAGEAAGRFVLRGTAAPPAATAVYAEPDDVALLLHTSGTTSRPKMVPLTHANLCASALGIGAALELSAADRCLNVMPLFHIHGLVGAVLSSLAAGASVVCTPGFYAPRFFEWLAEVRPTWYTAVPTMHQAILARASAHREAIAGAPLRFVRSSSAALPPQVLAELEEVFGAPVVEAYGMTEASHQMASNPLPPRPRKPGSVGVAAGPDVAVMDDAGRLLPAGATGEVVIRGASVTPGYLNNPAANESAFAGGWFRTGDQGHFDPEGYLFLTGRLKELINRGGEKISPREVDEALLDHPAVAQAVAFALPHPALGEEVAAAVVLAAGASATERELREHVATRLADFKVPRQVVFLPELPKGPTGKLQRIGLADRLGLASLPAPAAATGDAAPFVAPGTALEEAVAALWAGVLGVPRVGMDDGFLELGGDSMLATQLISRVYDAFGVEYSFLDLFEAPTPAGMAAALRSRTEGAA
jgi:acyl-CoA synthetase (AMP-forming)/AMP-acid ligase II